MRPTSKIAMLLITTLSSVCLPFSTINAGNEINPVPITLEHIGTKSKPKRPKVPSRQVITCAYDGEELHLSFVIPEGMATLSVTDETMLTATYEIDTTPLEVNVPVGELVGSIAIELETENGNLYNGTIE